MAKYIQTELGTEKQCIHCGEYFPATKEFFYGTGRIKKDGTQILESNCKDCYKQRFKPWVKKCNDVSYRYA
ncbi:hypothetical protein [Acinetobacter nectaris]|uniref:hypothetical protein n=1 Tax=Acinetobacter nectaris TaxID=1219382 RepID=UPI001F4857FE|nr:hypothetical protein [Acinetobacter nectaris]MCF9035306.1 hypothetical protein [Acinetobacter nectaris]